MRHVLTSCDRFVLLRCYDGTRGIIYRLLIVIVISIFEQLVRCRTTMWNSFYPPIVLFTLVDKFFSHFNSLYGTNKVIKKAPTTSLTNPILNGIGRRTREDVQRVWTLLKF